MTARLPRLPRIPWRKPAADVDDELQFHIDMAVAALVARGVPPDAARAEAERRFGVLSAIRDECLTIDERRRHRRATSEIMSAFLQDLAHAARSLRKTPMLTIAGSLTLMLGVGATTAMFSVVNGVLLRPLPYANADRLVTLDEGSGAKSGPMSYPEFIGWQKEGGEAFESVGAWFTTTLTLTGVSDPVVLHGQRVSASMPGLLGVKPILGRAFLPEEDGASGPRSIMLSSETWRTRFNADSSIIGKSLQLSGFPFTVVGVYPSGARSRLPNELTSVSYSDYWQGFRLDESRAPRSLHFLHVIARSRRGLTPQAMAARVNQVNGRVARDSMADHRATTTSLTARVVGDSRPLLVAIFGAVLLVLLVACANVANLLLARVSSRQREIAIRTALGAGRQRIVAQLLTESVLRAVVGSALGVALAYAALHILRQSLSVTIPRFAEVSIDPTVLAFALGLALVTGVAFGLVPALRSAGADPNLVMREGGRGVAGSLRKDAFRRALIIGELVMSFVLLAGAGLLIRSFSRLLAVPRGFQSDHVVTAAINLPGNRYGDSSKVVDFFDRLLDRVAVVPGVVSVAMSSDLPVQGGSNGTVLFEGRNYPTGKEPNADKRFASPAYFRTIGARIVAGRDFLDSDLITAPPVIIVNQRFAEAFFPGESAIGKRIGFDWETTGFQTIVGVVADIKEQALDAPVTPAIYMPMAQRSSSFMYLVVRSSVDELSLVPTLRRELRGLDANVPFERVSSLDDVIAEGVSGQRMTTSLLSSFSVAALLLAAIGLYGVVSYSVSQRNQELGIRAALGASRGEIVSGIIREGMGFVLFGVAVGAIAARGATKFISAQLFGVSVGDPAVYLSVAVLLFAVSLSALMLPALRASRVDPAIALREE